MAKPRGERVEIVINTDPGVSDYLGGAVVERGLPNLGALLRRALIVDCVITSQLTDNSTYAELLATQMRVEAGGLITTEVVGNFGLDPRLWADKPR